MLKNSSGNIIENEQAIFPLISFDSKQAKFKCIGTAFFFNSLGWFVTAKHVLFSNNSKMFEMIMGVQTLSTGVRVLRLITHLSIHPSADIAIGKLGVARDGKALEVPHELAPTFSLSFKKLEPNDKVIAFGYPRTTKNIEGTETTFSLLGRWTEGEVKEFLPNGSTLLKNKCYQTSMYIDTGASGGPVFKNNIVVGINSTGWDLEEGIEPLSYITPIDLVLELQVHIDDDRTVPVKYLIDAKHINVEY